jgi:uncharacterized protein YqgC (DUF456 family)
MWRGLRVAVGVSLLLLGAVGTLVPVVPGIPMIMAGVALMGTEHPWMRRILRRVRSLGGPRKADASP